MVTEQRLSVRKADAYISTIGFNEIILFTQGSLIRIDPAGTNKFVIKSLAE
jgi:hypothetical protein